MGATSFPLQSIVCIIMMNFDRTLSYLIFDQFISRGDQVNVIAGIALISTNWCVGCPLYCYYNNYYCCCLCCWWWCCKSIMFYEFDWWIVSILACPDKWSNLLEELAKKHWRTSPPSHGQRPTQRYRGVMCSAYLCATTTVVSTATLQRILRQ